MMDDRINRIYKSEKFQFSIKRIESLETNRKFCRHGIEHALDAARIAYITCLENHIKIKKDIVYAAALLHDIGRWMQYEEGISHEIGSCNLSYDILVESGYDNAEIELIQSAIMNHRSNNGGMNLSSILYKSDKLSRGCFYCSAINECNWSEEKKNEGIIY